MLSWVGGLRHRDYAVDFRGLCAQISAHLRFLGLDFLRSEAPAPNPTTLHLRVPTVGGDVGGFDQAALPLRSHFSHVLLDLHTRAMQSGNFPAQR